MRPAGFRTQLVALAVAALAISVPAGADAADATDLMAKAERLLGDGDAAAAIATMDEAVSAFWDTLPLHIRTAEFVEPGSVTQFSQYRPVSGAFRSGDVMSVYLEPVGYGLSPAGDRQTVDISAGIEIRSPGVIVYARAPGFAQLGWTGRTGTRELHGTLTLEVPALAPGSYELKIDLTDGATGKQTEVNLPFAVEETPEDAASDQS